MHVKEQDKTVVIKYFNYWTFSGFKILKSLKKIPKRETLGPFDWDLMGFIGIPLFKGQKIFGKDKEQSKILVT